LPASYDETTRTLPPASRLPAERRARVAAPPILKEIGGIHPSILPVLVENCAIAVELVFHAGCWYSVISPASLGRGWIGSVGTGKGSTAGSSPGARRPVPWPWWLRPAL
jgi:hypothetical protein